MPMYDFECPKGHVTEHFLSAFAETRPCSEEGCTEVAANRPSFWYSSSTRFAQRFSPVVIHRDELGNVRFRGSADAPVPAGFQKVELANIHEIRKFEREMNAKDAATADKFRSVRASFLDGQLKANRDAVDEIARGGVWMGTDENGRPVERRGISPRGLKILEQLRAASKMKQEAGRSHSRPEFFLEAFSKDASNREHHRDAATGWQRVRK